jgi:hypothetical protein
VLRGALQVAAAKRVIPAFGPLYGMFSRSFVHISHGHFALNPVIRITPEDGAVRANLSFLRTAVWLLLVVTELAFYPHASSPRYWHPVKEAGGKPKYAYRPGDEEEAWRQAFLGKWRVADEQ